MSIGIYFGIYVLALFYVAIFAIWLEFRAEKRGRK